MSGPIDPSGRKDWTGRKVPTQFPKDSTGTSGWAPRPNALTKRVGRTAIAEEEEDGVVTAFMLPLPGGVGSISAPAPLATWLATRLIGRSARSNSAIRPRWKPNRRE